MSSLSQKQNDKDTVPLIHRGNYFWQVYMHLGHLEYSGSPERAIAELSVFFDLYRANVGRH